MVVTGSWGGEAALAPHQCQVPPGDAVSPGAHSELPVCPPALCIQMRCCPPGPSSNHVSKGKKTQRSSKRKNFFLPATSHNPCLLENTAFY